MAVIPDILLKENRLPAQQLRDCAGDLLSHTGAGRQIETAHHNGKYEWGSGTQAPDKKSEGGRIAVGYLTPQNASHHIGHLPVIQLFCSCEILFLILVFPFR